MAEDKCDWEWLTFLDYVATSYPDPSWMGAALTPAERSSILAFSFKHWKQHSPYMKGLLALTLKRSGRPKDAALVWASVMDSAKTDRDLGTYWAPEDRSWLWYNDTIETQAFALRTLMELDPSDSRRHGLVQWLFLNKKMNQWKSTRATAEVIYSLVWYLKKEGALGAREDVSVEAGGQKTTFAFEPDRYTGKRNQVVVPGEKIDPTTDATIAVSKGGKGLAFASATWNFSTEKLPAEDRGDFFAVSRKYFKREASASGFIAHAAVRGRDARSRRRGRGPDLAFRKARRRVRPPARPARGGAGAGRRRLGLQVGPRDLLVRGDAGLGHELLLRAAAGGAVHAQVPRAREHGGDVQGRPGDGAVALRAGVQRVLERGDGDGAVDLRH